MTEPQVAEDFISGGVIKGSNSAFVIIVANHYCALNKSFPDRGRSAWRKVR
jgi:hypothetical protein